MSSRGPSWRSFGAADVLALCDASGPFFQPLAHAFPDASEAALRDATERDPHAAAPNGGWLLRFRSFAIRLDDGRTFLVDAGIGPADAPAAPWAPVPGRLPQLLAAAGITPESVNALVLTHLHEDHVGWAVVNGEPFFPNARYVVQHSELAALDASSSLVRMSVVDPLRRDGRLDVIAGRAQLAEGVTAIHTPGHTPGHQSVLVSANGEDLIITGDVLVHAVQLVDPTVAYAHETDAEAARCTRIRMLDQATTRRALLATAHLGQPFTRVT